MKYFLVETWNGEGYSLPHIRSFDSADFAWSEYMDAVKAAIGSGHNVSFEEPALDNPMVYGHEICRYSVIVDDEVTDSGSIQLLTVTGEWPFEMYLEILPLVNNVAVLSRHWGHQDIIEESPLERDEALLRNPRSFGYHGEEQYVHYHIL